MVQRPLSRQPDAEKVVDLKLKEAVRPHVKMSLEDINWIRAQPPCVQQLWLDCVAVEQFGGQQRILESSLCDRFFRRAKTALEERKLFRFEPITQLSPAGRLKITGWKVENLHGYYNKQYWEFSPSSEQNVRMRGTKCSPHPNKMFLSSEQNVPLIRTKCSDVEPKTLAGSAVENSQLRLNHSPTTPQPPTKVVGGGIGGVGIPKETEESPLGGIPPTRLGMPEEQEESDSLTLNLNPPPPPAIGGSEFRADSANVEINHSLASLVDQAEVAGEDEKPLGEDQLSAVPPLPVNFPIQVGDTVTLDWPDSPFHGRSGIVQGVDLFAGEADIRFDGMDFDATFPIARLFHADPAASSDELMNQPDDASPITACDNSESIAAICDFALAQDFKLEDSDKKAMIKLSPEQLEKTLEVFEKRIAQHSCFSTTTKRDLFWFALKMGQHSS